MTKIKYFFNTNLALTVMMSLNAYAGSIESDLNSIAVQTQKHLPAQVAEGVTATAMASIGKNIMMQYRLSMDAKTFKKDKEILNDLIKSSIATQCSNPQMRSLIVRGAMLNYMFHDRNGIWLAEITVNQEICKKNNL
jgi:hypothetical protein